MALDLDSLNEKDHAARDWFQAIVSKVENALFLTFRAADTPSMKNASLREESKTAWRELADDVIEYAMAED